jgi:tetratricopeptide (TPR) repeat protein
MRKTIMSESRLQHVPFFEALSRAEEGSPEWRLTSAGLVTLRLFDAWLVEGPSVVSAGAWGLRAVREAIDAIESSSSSKAILGSIVDAMEATGMVRVPLVAPRLLAYGRALQFDGHFAMAADVHATVLAHAHPVEEADLVVAASMQMGACLRAMADWDEALAAFSRAACVAAMSSDIATVLRARIAEANVTMERGNLPRAQTLLDETIQEASATNLRDVRSRARHARAVVAMRRQDFEFGIRLAYEALSESSEPSERDRILSDIAVAFYDLGCRAAARDAYLILAATAQEQYFRWIATINLMECAAADGREPVFEQYRRELADASLPASLACQYYFYLGEGYRLFAHMNQAKTALGRSLAIATQHQINEMIIRAEQALQQVADGGVVIIAQESTPSPELAEVADAIRDMRELAGVG